MEFLIFIALAFIGIELSNIHSVLQDIRNGLEKQEKDKRMINAKNRKKDADREIKDIEASLHYDYERQKEEKQRYNGYY